MIVVEVIDVEMGERRGGHRGVEKSLEEREGHWEDGNGGAGQKRKE